MNYYQILGIKTNATTKEIKKSYRTLAKKYHPDTYKGDKILAEEKMKDINEAYDVLSDLELKEAYDKQIGVNQPNSATSNTDSYNRRDYDNGYSGDKDGVYKPSQYTPNSRNIHYDKDGYAKSNYSPYTEEGGFYAGSEIHRNVRERSIKEKVIYIMSIIIIGIIAIWGCISLMVKSITEGMNITPKSAESEKRMERTVKEIKEHKIDKEVSTEEKNTHSNSDLTVEITKEDARILWEKIKNDILKAVEEVKE